MFKRFQYFSVLLLFTSAVLLTSCSKKEDTPDPIENPQDKYAVWLQIGSWPNTTQYILGANSLTEGAINLEGMGAEVTGKSAYGIITRGGHYYYYNTTTGRFSKFKYENDLYNTVLEVPYTHMSDVSGFTWIDDKTLFLVGTDGEQQHIHYSVVNIETLKMTNGVLDAPAIPSDAKYFNLGNVEYTNGKVFVQYGFSNDWPAPWKNVMHIGVVDYATLKYEKTLTSTTSAGPGTNKLWLSSSFVTESGDLYFGTHIEWSKMTDGQTAIYRIKKGTTALDATYNVTESTIGYQGVGLWYLGENLAIYKYIDPAVKASGKAHYYGFAVMNLETGKITRQLSEIPKDNSDYIQNIIVEDGKAYLVTNAESGKDYVYIYDIKAGTVKTGMEMIGGYDYILRLDRMY